MRRLTAVWPILFVGCLVLSGSGCCRQPYVLHGDWTLWLNRARGCGDPCTANCQCPACGQCGNNCQCAGTDQCAAGGRCQLDENDTDTTEPVNAAELVPRGAGGKRCALVARKGRAKAAAVAAVPGPTGPALGHPRFHPVPTRPVFGPIVQPTMVPVPVEAPPIEVDVEPIPTPEPATGPNSARRRVLVRRGSVRQVTAYSAHAPQ